MKKLRFQLVSHANLDADNNQSQFAHDTLILNEDTKFDTVNER